MKDQTQPQKARKVARWWIRGGIIVSVLAVVLLHSLPREMAWVILICTTTLSALVVGIYLGWAKGYEDAIR